MTRLVPRRPHANGVPQVRATGRLPSVALHNGSRYDHYLKPVIDWFGAVLLVLLLAPLMFAVAVTVWLELGAPAIIRQRRVGRGGRVFEMLKFRTMHPDRRREQRPIPPHKDRRTTHKSADDPRHTGVGRFLRRRCLDELPQLFNVLAGHMSLVGPRPELADVVERIYEPWQLQRHLVKPGITGLWQVTRRTDGNGDMHLHTEDDLEYIEKQSLWMDLRIMLRTPRVVVAPRRAGQ